MSDRERPEWESSYFEAVLEVEPGKRDGRIQLAETLLARRRAESQASADGHSERQAIEKALNGLLTMKQENFPR
jgi:hypothetical protein